MLRPGFDRIRPIGARRAFEDGLLVENTTDVAVILERRVREGLATLAREGMLVS
jgi:hypothetical protein